MLIDFLNAGPALLDKAFAGNFITINRIMLIKISREIQAILNKCENLGVTGMRKPKNM